MSYKVWINEIEVKDEDMDGDWFTCPYCEHKSCIVKSFNYCPMCAEKVYVREEYS